MRKRNCLVKKRAIPANVFGLQIEGKFLSIGFGFYPTDNCGTTYFTVQFRGVNAKGFGDYSDGFMPVEGATGEGSIVPGCRVADDFSHALGDPAEGRLATALGYRDSSVCPVSTSAARPAGVGPAAAHILESRDGTSHRG